MRRSWLLSFVLGCALGAIGQQCPPPEIPAPPLYSNFFSDQQEMWLGEVVAQRVERDYRLTNDPAENRKLQEIGDRLLRGLPTGMTFRFRVVDLPMVNALTLPGGRIYVTRKMIAAVHSEDELAGVLGHEIGHALTHQPAVSMTALFRGVLNVNSVGDRADIYAKYNQVLDNIGRNPAAAKQLQRNEKDETLVDRIGIFAATRAGYDPNAAAQFWDRISVNRGHSGSWLSNFFGATRPESRRYRDLVKDAAGLPSACVAKPDKDQAGFTAWQRLVVESAGLGRQSSLPGLVWQKKLDPPLRPEIDNVRFSPDGKYILAQDDSAIHVFTQQPLAFVFTIDAPGARPAQFSPDSQSIVFHTPALRIERWNLSAKRREQVSEVTTLDTCIRTALSPTADQVACLTPEFNLKILDVATSAVLFERDRFYVPSFADFIELLSMLANFERGSDWQYPLAMTFSPDGRYFLAGRGDFAVAVDTATHKEMKIPGSVREIMGRWFGFMGKGRIAGMNLASTETRIVSFPEGKTLTKLHVWANQIVPATHGEFIVLLPVKGFAAGIEDVEQQKIAISAKQAAMDIYDGVYARENVAGELALLHVSDGKLFARAPIPLSNLGVLRAAAVSGDLRWLSLSGKSRGAEWYLPEMRRIFHVRGFDGASILSDGSVVADFPPFEKDPRVVARLYPSSGQVVPLFAPAAGSGFDEDSGQMLEFQPRKKNGGTSRDVTMKAEDLSGKPLWSLDFPRERPVVNAGPGNVLLLWNTSDGGGRAEMESDPRLLQVAGHDRKGNYLAEVLSSSTGKVESKVLIPAGNSSFRLEGGTAGAGILAVADDQGRVLVYSLATGELVTNLFGNRPLISVAAGLLAVETDRDEITLFDAKSLQPRDPYVFPGAISFVQFSADGRQLFVVTRDQSAFVLDVSAHPEPQAAN